MKAAVNVADDKITAFGVLAKALNNQNNILMSGIPKKDGADELLV